MLKGGVKKIDNEKKLMSSRVITRKSYDLTRLFDNTNPACKSLVGENAGKTIERWVGTAPFAKASVTASEFGGEWTARTKASVIVPTAIVDAVAEIADSTTSNNRNTKVSNREFTVYAYGPSTDKDLRIVEIPAQEIGAVIRRHLFVVSNTEVTATEAFTLAVGELATHTFVVQSLCGRSVSIKGLETSFGTALTFGGSETHDIPARKGGFRARTQKLTPNRRCVLVVDEMTSSSSGSSKIAALVQSMMTTSKDGKSEEM